MNKRTVYVSLAAALTIAAFTGCSESGAFQTMGKDYRVKPDFVCDTAGKEVVENTMIITDYAFEPTLENLCENAGHIIRGTVDNILYTTLDGKPYMQLDVSINKAYGGELSEGDAVSVYAMGGYNLCPDASGENSGDALVNGLRECLTNDAPLPEKGMEYLLFMSESSGSRPDGAYELCTGYEYGLFGLSTSGYINENSGESFTSDELTAALKSGETS